MSLINDALKQARESQQQNPPSGQPPLRPVEPPPRRAADWFLPVIVVLLAGAAAYFIGIALAHRKPAAKAPEISVKQPAVAIVATNPAAISNAATASVAGMKLQGIIYGNKSWAIVDGKTVYVGDSLEGFRVKEIAPDSITLQGSDGSQQKLKLGD